MARRGASLLGMMIIYQDFFDGKDAVGGQGMEIGDVSYCRDGRGGEEGVLSVRYLLLSSFLPEL
jgi:hypothetical protein